MTEDERLQVEATPSTHNDAILAWRAATGAAYDVKLRNLPRRRSHRLPADDHQLKYVLEPDPADIELALINRSRTMDPGPVTGQTPEQWLAAGGIKTILPPGNAVANPPQTWSWGDYNNKKKSLP